MAHEILGLCRRFQESVEHLMERLPVFHGMFSGDAVHHLGFDGNDEAFRLHQQVVVLHKIAMGIMQLPS